MAGAIAQPRNSILDIADLIGKVAPMLVGSGKTTTQQYLSSSIDPTVAAQSDELLNSLTQRGNSTVQSDKVVEDILYRAQLAFAPVLGEEKASGMYNTTARTQMAKESVARATAAASQAVLQDQQHAFAQATSISNQRVAASRSQSQTTTAKTAPNIGIKGALGGIGASMIANVGAKKGGKVLSDLWDKFTAPDPGATGLDKVGAIDPFAFDESSLVGNLAGGGSNPMQTAGDFGPMNVGGANAEPVPSIFTADDTAALKGIIDSVTIPTPGMPGAMAVASAAPATDSPQGLNSPIDPSAPMAMNTTVPTTAIGSNLVVDKNSDFPVLGRDGNASLQDASTLLEEPASSLATDPFAFDGSALAGGDAALGTGLDIPGAVDPFAFDPSSLSSGGDLLGGLAGMPIPYFAIANAVTGGELSKTVMSIPVVGGAYKAVGDAINEIPIVGDASRTFNEDIGHSVDAADNLIKNLDDPNFLFNEAITGGGETAGAVIDDSLDQVQNAGDFVDSIANTASGACFITTAATRGGESDNGHTLTVLRAFRDSYMEETIERRIQVEQYYLNAPIIVARISARNDAELIWMRVRKNYLAEAVAAIEGGKPELAHSIYTELYNWLRSL